MRERFESLQVLRGIACLLVVAFHIAGIEGDFGLGFAPFRPFLWFGFAGVDLFFILSGFIITSTCWRDLGNPSRASAYLFRRAWRIYPTYWIALLLTATHFVLTSPKPLIHPEWRTELVNSLFLLPPPNYQMPRLLPVAWSLSYELMFYLGFAVLFLLPRRAAPFALIGWGLVVVGAKATAFVPENRFARLALHPFVLEFLLGCLIARLPVWLGRWQAAGMLGVAVAWCAIGMMLTITHDPEQQATAVWERFMVFGVPMALVVLAFTGRERSGRLLRRGWLSKIGDASYSIYLIHMTTLFIMLYLSMLVKMSHTRAPHCLWLVLMLVAGVLPGLLLHRWVESPLLRLGKRPKTPHALTATTAPSMRQWRGTSWPLRLSRREGASNIRRTVA